VLQDRLGISHADWDRAAVLGSESGARLSLMLIRLGLVAEDQLESAFSQEYSCGRLSEHAGPPEALKVDSLLPAYLRAKRACPILSDEKTCLRVAMFDPSDTDMIKDISFATGMELQPVVARLSVIDALLESLETGQPSAEADYGENVSSEGDSHNLDRLRDLASEAPVIRLVQRLISDAVTRKASDIHIEPGIQQVHVRNRVDGLLQEIEQLPLNLAAAIASRIKIMANLNIAERRLPQDGRIRIAVMGRETEFRVATSPVLHGESVVLRILDRGQVVLNFEALGFAHAQIEAMRRGLAQPHGMILVTGPTGSGKTTTLYAALKELNTPERKILTAEDPIEYSLERVNQVQVKPQIGLDFSHALRSFLRQDPDVILVGEIRDAETARIAVQASLTGHLLLSTVHTNSAAGAITRLRDMGVEEYLLASTVMLVVGQRLVRKLCPECKLAEAVRSSQAPWAGAGTESISLYRPVGCAACKGAGYQGRIVISEVLEVSEAVRGAVLQCGDTAAIEKVAVAEGMKRLEEDGYAKVLAGQTTVEEVLRVTSVG
jgi:general secretion pathway protein E